MTFAASATCRRDQLLHQRGRCAFTLIELPVVRKRKRAAFTLIELLVVIGIIVLVVSITIPMVMRTFRAGDRARSAADIQSISVALEAFKADFGDYPRPDPTQNTGVPNAGFALLGRYLIGPYGDGLDTSQTPAVGDPNDPPMYSSGGSYDVGSCVRTGSQNPPQGPTFIAVATPGTTAPVAGNPNGVWQQFNVNDGADGPGIKNNGRGKTLGPYLQPDKFKVRGLAILDRSGAPILYFVRAPGQRNTHNPGLGGQASYAGPSIPGAAYNTDDNEIFFRASGETDKTYSTKALEVLMGDTNIDGYIDNNETEVNLPYILWSAGPDGVFGPYRNMNADPSLSTTWTTNMLQKYDDVTNFR